MLVAEVIRDQKKLTPVGPGGDTVKPDDGKNAIPGKGNDNNNGGTGEGNGANGGGTVTEEENGKGFLEQNM